MKRMKSACVRAVFVVAVVCLLSLTALSSGLSEDYHPLTIGCHWEYHSAILGELSMSIVGDRDILGVTTRVRRQVRPDQVYENFWSKDASGNLFLHGAVNFTFPFEAAYVPPIKMVAPPLFLGKAWVTNAVRTFKLDGTPWDDAPFDYPLRVYTAGIDTVPAGDFYSYGVGYDTPFGVLLSSGKGTFDLLGRRVTGGQLATDNATHWYSDGVGLVQSCDYTDRQYAYKLLSFEIPSVPTQSPTWGSVKEMYKK
jgi:hypothetical protein